VKAEWAGGALYQWYVKRGTGKIDNPLAGNVEQTMARWRGEQYTAGKIALCNEAISPVSETVVNGNNYLEGGCSAKMEGGGMSEGGMLILSCPCRCPAWRFSTATRVLAVHHY
jgi:hypothetical protein